jgi:hypothetical protein
VPFSIGKRYRGLIDSCHEIPEKPADSPEAGFDGEMMAPRCSVPGNHHTGDSPSGSAASSPPACIVLSPAKNVGAAGVLMQHPLAKHGLLGQ